MELLPSNHTITIPKLVDDDELAEYYQNCRTGAPHRTYANNPRYANLVGHLMAAGNELIAIIRENKANEN